jgi:hypothetical protein
MGQRFDRTDPLKVQAENTGQAPTPWAWAIYRGSERSLIVRSRSEYSGPADALEAGLKAAATVGHRLRVEVVIEEVSPAGSASR